MKRTVAALFLLCLVLALPALAQARKEVPLSLEDSIVRVLKDNLNLAVEVLNPDLAQANLTLAKEIFMPQLALNFGNDNQESRSTWWLQGSGTTTMKSMTYGLGLTQLFPTGGQLELSLANNRSETNQPFQLFNPYYRTSLNFSFSQPLLQGFGPKIAGREIQIAKVNIQQSESQFRKLMMDVVFQVEEAYWNLVYAIENLKVKRQSLELARELWAKTKKEVDFGQTAPIELLNAEATVAQREADILQAEALVKRNDEVLRAMLNLRPEQPGEELSVIPSDKPEFRKAAVSYDELIAKALVKRPELEAVRLSIEGKRINFRVAKNQLLPSLDLKLSYYSPGIAGDRILYQDDNPFTGIIVGVEPGSPWDAVRDAFKFLYNNWSVSLNLSVPMADLFSRAGYTYSRLDLEKAQAQLKLQEQQVALEVSDAVRNLETDAKRVDAYRVARELAEKRLEAETKKLGVGLTTNYFVLEYQEKLANARSAELKALVDYNISLARVEKASGEILDKRRISIR
jgi:outer membrane protein TolC